MEYTSIILFGWRAGGWKKRKNKATEELEAVAEKKKN